MWIRWEMRAFLVNLVRIRWKNLSVNLGLLASRFGLSAIPAYLLSRYWVWQKRGKNHFWREVVPFWSLAFVGLLALAAILQRLPPRT